LKFCHRAGYLPELARVCLDYAEFLIDTVGLQSSGNSNHEKARMLLDDNRGISSDLGMPFLLERANSVAERLNTTSMPAPANPDGLNTREMEILRLLASGKTNREIAESLFISLKTVANHVTNIFNKTNCANRVEASNYAHRTGIV